METNELKGGKQLLSVLRFAMELFLEDKEAEAKEVKDEVGGSKGGQIYVTRN